MPAFLEVLALAAALAFGALPCAAESQMRASDLLGHPVSAGRGVPEGEITGLLLDPQGGEGFAVVEFPVDAPARDPGELTRRYVRASRLLGEGRDVVVSFGVPLRLNRTPKRLGNARATAPRRPARCRKTRGM